MKSLKIFAILTLAVLTTGLVSCKKENVEQNLTEGLTGTYTGTLTTTGKAGISPATADITAINDYTIQVHCYGEDIDTTIHLELYPDGNMMRVCFTDNDFYNEYGHNKNENHHMMGDNGGWTNWNQHMSNDHNRDDKHYGYFNMENHQFDYTFVVNTATSSYTQEFSGARQ